MVEGLDDHGLEGLRRVAAPGFTWRGDASCGVERGLRAFREGWQRPVQGAFSAEARIEEARIEKG